MKRKLDLMSFIGWVIAAACVFFGTTIGRDLETGRVIIVPEQAMAFIDLTSALVVMGGTFAALMISFPMSAFAKMGKHMKLILFPRTYVPTDYITTLVEFAKKARINGLLALEEDLETIDDAFMKNSMMMVVDSVDPEKVKQQLEARMGHLDSRHSGDRAFYSKGAAFAPAFGMFGTMFGLINMLGDLQDFESLGPNMAVCLITTFYGLLLANVFFTPIANKLQARHDEELLCNMIIVEGVQAIQAGENPKFIQERLINLLPQYKHRHIGEGGGKEADAGGGGGGKKK